MSELNVKFGAEDVNLSSTLNKVQKDLKQVETQSKETNEKFEFSFKGMAVAAAGVAVGIGAIKLAFSAVQGTIASFGEALDMGGRLSDLSARTGETAGKVLLLERAFTNAGSSAEKVGPTINKLQKFIMDVGDESPEAVKAMSKLGLTFSELKDQSPTDQLKSVAEALSGIESPTERGALAMKVFGKSGGELLPFLRDFSGGLDNAKTELGRMVEIMDKKAAVFDTVSDKINILKGKFVEFAAGVLSKTVPALELITTALSRIDAAAIGESFADIFVGGQSAMEGFSDALNAMKIGEFKLAFEIAFESVKLQAAQSANSIYANFKAASAAAAEFLLVALGPGSGVWTVILSGVEMAFGKMSEMIGKSIYSMIKDLPFIGDSVKRDLLDNIALVEKGVENSSNKMKNSIGQIPGDFILAANESKRRFEESLAAAGKLVETSGMELNIQKSKAELMKIQSDHALAAIKNQGNFNELEIKIGGQRVSNAERIAELEVEIKDAKAQGNAELEKQLIAQKTYYEQLERSLKAGKTEQQATVEASKAYEASLQGALNEAEKLANANARSRKDMVEIKTIGELIAATNVAAPMKTYSERVKESRVDLKALADFVGGDFSRMSVPDIAKKLGIETAKKSSKDLLDEIQKRMDKIKDRPVDIKINKNATKEQLAEIEKNIASMNTNKTVKLDAGSSMNDIIGSIKKEIEIDLSSINGSTSSRNSVMESIKTAVETIKELVAKIEPKLPTSALGI